MKVKYREKSENYVKEKQIEQTDNRNDKEDKNSLSVKGKRIGFVSDIRSDTRFLIIFISVIMSICVAVISAIVLISTTQEDEKLQSEQTVIAASEQYIDTSIENIVSIAKTVYTNNTLYNFLNVDYATSADYYDAYYKLTENNSLIIAENNNIRKFTVYTDNKSILNGGNISNLEDVKKTEWYNDFINIKKDMIVYCDSQNGYLSIIRKLDYYKIDTGDCLLKIDFNQKNLTENFKDLEFDGNVYVMSKGIVLYSNLEDAKIPNAEELKRYTSLNKNYYTAEIEYYVYARRTSVLEIVLNSFLYIPIIAVTCIALILIIVILKNIFTRLVKLAEFCEENGKGNKFENTYYGTDEIGRVYHKCAEMITAMEMCENDKNKLRNTMSKYVEEAESVMVKAYNLDAAISYEKKTSDIGSFDKCCSDVPISFEQELTYTSKYLENFKNKTDKNLNYKITYHISDISNAYVLPFSILHVADDIMKYSLKTVNECDIEFIIDESEKSYIIVIKEYKSKMMPNKLLKLRAIFEFGSENTDINFKRDDEYNPYLRLKKFYKDKINVNVTSDSEIRFELFISKDVMNDINAIK